MVYCATPIIVPRSDYFRSIFFYNPSGLRPPPLIRGDAGIGAILSLSFHLVLQSISQILPDRPIKYGWLLS